MPDYITTCNANYDLLTPSLEVSALEEWASAIHLLCTVRPQDTYENWEITQTSQIVREFSHFALAIAQAGSYIHME